MKPPYKIDTQNAGELIQKLERQKIIQKRFNVEMPVEELSNAIFAAYSVEVTSRRNQLIIDNDTKQHIRLAAEWLADENAKSGLMLAGSYGNGKTTLMCAICNLINCLFDSSVQSECIKTRIIEAREIARIGSREETRDLYSKLLNADILAIDDLGEEPAEIISYGMAHTPVKDLLLERYRRQKLTIVSTNLVNTENKKQLTEHYGARVVDRFREMMKIIVFKNNSYRGVLN